MPLNRVRWWRWARLERFPPDSPEGRLCREGASAATPAPPPDRARISVPPSVGVAAGRTTSTQEAFGRILVSGYVQFQGHHTRHHQAQLKA